MLCHVKTCRATIPTIYSEKSLEIVARQVLTLDVELKRKLSTGSATPSCVAQQRKELFGLNAAFLFWW